MSDRVEELEEGFFDRLRARTQGKSAQMRSGSVIKSYAKKLERLVADMQNDIEKLKGSEDDDAIVAEYLADRHVKQMKMLLDQTSSGPAFARLRRKLGIEEPGSQDALKPAGRDEPDDRAKRRNVRGRRSGAVGIRGVTEGLSRATFDAILESIVEDSE